MLCCINKRKLPYNLFSLGSSGRFQSPSAFSTEVHQQIVAEYLQHHFFCHVFELARRDELAKGPLQVGERALSRPSPPVSDFSLPSLSILQKFPRATPPCPTASHLAGRTALDLDARLDAQIGSALIVG